jgi:chitin disaccharide deacetylase
VRRLIINADDFGLTKGVNRGIEDCHKAGSVTSATLMANSMALEEAVSIAKANPALGVGCHVMLVDGEPLTGQAATTLLRSDGRTFRVGIAEFAWAALRGKLNDSEIYNEAVAQIQKLQSSGISVDHFDTHKHTHMFPSVLRPLLRAAKDCGVPAVRNPFVPLKTAALAHILKRPSLWTRTSEVAVLRSFRDQFQNEVAKAGLKTTDGSFGVIATGSLDKRLTEAILGSIPDGTWEFVCHPGYNDGDLDSVKTRLRKTRDIEADILKSSSLSDFLAKNRLELIRFSQV